MTTYQWVSLALGALTLGVLAATLRWIKRYTKAAESQVEALHRPFMTIKTFPTVYELKDAIELGPAPTDKAAHTIVLHNIGPGPAINVEYEIRKPGAGVVWTSSGQPAAPLCPPLGRDATQNTLYLRRDLVDGTEVSISCESVSGHRYVNRVQISEEHKPGIPTVIRHRIKVTVVRAPFPSRKAGSPV